MGNIDLRYIAFVRRYHQVANGTGKGNLILRSGEDIVSRPDTQSFLMSRFEQEEPAVKLAIAVAISRVSGDQSPIGIYETLLEAIKTPQKFQAEYDGFAHTASDAPLSCCHDT